MSTGHPSGSQPGGKEEKNDRNGKEKGKAGKVTQVWRLMDVLTQILYKPVCVEAKPQKST